VCRMVVRVAARVGVAVCPVGWKGNEWDGWREWVFAGWW